jgi:hypothetical protein
MTPFDFSNDISHKKEHIMVDEYTESLYVPFVVNRALSLFPDTLFHVNEMNINSHLDKKLQYEYLYNSVRKKKRFEKWPWKKVDSSDIDLICSIYKYNRVKAREVLSVLTNEQLSESKKQQEKGG